MKDLSNRQAAVLIVLLAFILRFSGVAGMDSFVWDEEIVIPAVDNFLENGQFEPDSWTHLPLMYYLSYCSMKVFGNNPYGWRMGFVLMGTLSVYVIYRLGRELFPEGRIACLAALFMSLEPLHIYFSRTTQGETISVTAFLIFVVIVMRHIKDSRTSLVPAGLFLGAAVADKWYYISAAFALIAFMSLYKYGKGELKFRTLIYIAATLVVLPSGIYLLAHYPWFQRGYNIAEFFERQHDVYDELQSLRLDRYISGPFRSSPSSPLGWFTTPILYVRMLAHQGGLGRFEVFMNNPPVWLAAFPAMLFTAFRARLNKERLLAALPVLFTTLYLQFAFIKKPVFIYSSLVVLPFVYLSVAFMLVSLLDRWKASSVYYRAIIPALLLWGLYLYPFAAGKFVPVWLYRPLTALGRVLQ